MSDAEGPPPLHAALAEEVHLSRLQVVADLLVFQLKLLADGLRDLILSPISIAAAVAGLVAGGDRPDRYLRKVVKFGRRTERWINLFGEHDGPGTADHLVDPLRTRVIDEVQANPWLTRAGAQINRQLDQVNSSLSRSGSREPGRPDRETAATGDDGVRPGPD